MQAVTLVPAITLHCVACHAGPSNRNTPGGECRRGVIKFGRFYALRFVFLNKVRLALLTRRPIQRVQSL